MSDRDPMFTSTIWTTLLAACSTALNTSTAFHPQTDGHSDAGNKVITMYLWCMTGDRPRQWVRWLPWAEFVYNTSYHSSLGTTPFKVVYSRELPAIRDYEPGELRVAAVTQTLVERDAFLADIRGRLE